MELFYSIVIFVVVRDEFTISTVGRNWVDRTYRSDVIPIVLWHGMGDNCCNPLSMGYMMKLLRKNIDGVYVVSVKIGDSIIEDTTSGFFGNANEQVASVCQMIANNSKLANGYNAIGFSQGGQLLRAVAQRCPYPPMKTLISFGGQQQGISGLPHCPEYSAVCNTVRHMLNYGAYTRVVQDHVIQAQYWHDPMAELKYRETSIFLADINNEKMINQTYKENLQKLKRLVLVKFKKDSIVVPRETEWFGFYKENDMSSLIAMEETKLFVEDRIGLKKLKDSGRLHMISVEGDHLQMKEDEFVTKIINKYLR